MKRFAAFWLAVLLWLGTTAYAETSFGVQLPEGYAEGSPLPVLRALERTDKQAPFFDTVDPAWFNPGAYSCQNTSRRSRWDLFTFEDTAQLEVGWNEIGYTQHDGVYTIVHADDPEHPEGPFPRESFAVAVGNLAGTHRYYTQLSSPATSDAPLSPQEVFLEREELTGITFASAREQAEALLDKLGLSGYELVYRMDMSVAQIQTLGAWQALLDAQNTLSWHVPQFDYSAATVDDEGYFLRYEKRLNGLPVGNLDAGSYYAQFFINAGGIASFRLWNTYAEDGEAELPQRLLTAEQAAACFERDNARRERDGFQQSAITSMQLRYAPTRARNQKDAMVFEPAWYITYESAGTDHFWVWYSAVDGRLMMDCYS